MRLWISLLIMSLSIPVTMIGPGKPFQSHTLEKINSLFGYCASMSIKNRDTWEFIHHYCGKLWRRLGWGVLAFTIIFVIIALGKDDDMVFIYVGIISTVQVALLLLPICSVERVLRKSFDKDDKKRL